jgi:polysaccharide biosynthesis protein PslH
MRLLWLNAGLLLPLDKGGKLRTWHVMRHIARRHDITYLCFEDPSATQAERDGMREVCRELVTVPRADAEKGTLRFYADAARYVIDRVPYAVAKYRSDAYRTRIEQLLRERRFDAVVCDFLPPAINLPGALPCPGVMFTHNVEAEIWRRHAENASNPASRYLFGQQWRRMLRFEADTLARFSLVLAVSDADSSGCIPAACRRRCTSWRQASIPHTSRRRMNRRPARIWCSQDRWTGCRTKMR